MTAITPIGRVEYFEDFLIDPVGLIETVGTGGSQDVAGIHGGAWRQTSTTAETADGMAATELNWEVDQAQPVIFEAKVKPVTSIAAVSSFVGLSDAATETGGVVIEDEDGTLNTVPTNAVGFLMENEQLATWQGVGVQAGVDNAQVDLGGEALAIGTYQTVRMELWTNSSGRAEFYLDGELKSAQTGFVNTAIVYTPVWTIGGRATAYSLDWDYIFVSAPRD